MSSSPEKEAAIQACQAALEKKGENVTLLDFNGRSLMADYFVIVTGRSQPHARAIAQGIQEALDESKSLVSRRKIEGYPNSSWILLDYSALVVHVFTAEERDYYNLEKLWSFAEIQNFGEGTPETGGTKT